MHARLKASLSGTFGLFLLFGCASESATGPSTFMAESDLNPSPRSIASARTMVGELWGRTIAQQRLIVRRLEDTHPNASLSAHSRVLQSGLAQLAHDSASAVETERRRRASGASFDYVGIPQAGMINREMSVTQFWMPSNPMLFVQTYLTIPAMYIHQRTIGECPFRS